MIGEDAVVTHSLVTGGCEINGQVENSVLFQSVTVAKGAQIRYSILMPGTVIEEDAVVEYAILAENTFVGRGAHVGASPDQYAPEEWGVAVLGSGVSIPDGEVVPPKAMLESPDEEDVL